MQQNINIIGVYTLYMKEVRRFLKVYNQTLIAPVVTAMLFLAVFNLAVGGHVENVGAVPFGQFMAAGLIMMSLMQNAFANSSSSLTMGKVLGVIIDYLMPPLNAFETIFALVMAGITRGIAVGLLVALCVWVFVPLEVHNVPLAIFYLFFSAMLMTLLGIITGIIAESFDQMAAVTSYIITPLAFLSGTFYSVNNLPGFWHNVSHFNPFFYMIDGLRYSMTGHNDGDILIGIIVILATNVVLWGLSHVMWATGYRIKE